MRFRGFVGGIGLAVLWFGLVNSALAEEAPKVFADPGQGEAGHAWPGR